MSSPKVAYNLTQPIRDKAIVLESSSSVNATLLDRLAFDSFTCACEKTMMVKPFRCVNDFFDIHLPFQEATTSWPNPIHSNVSLFWLLSLCTLATYPIWLGAQA